MTTGAQAVDRVAEAAGILPATVFRAARTLREHDPALWPAAGKGGGKRAAHVTASHLVNLALALALAEPITAAPEVVRKFEPLERVFPLEGADTFPGAFEATQFLTFGEALATLTGQIGRQSEYHGVAADVGFEPGGRPFAEVSLLRRGGDENEATISRLGLYWPSRDDARTAAAAALPAGLRKVVTLPFALFDLFKELSS